MVLFRKMNCAKCTEKRILKNHEVSKRGKEESRGKDVEDVEDVRRETETCDYGKERNGRSGKKDKEERKREKSE